MKWADGAGDSLLIYDHNSFWVNSDKVLVRHAYLFATRQFQRERMKAILQPASDLLDNHAGNLPPRTNESMLQRVAVERLSKGIVPFSPAWPRRSFAEAG